MPTTAMEFRLPTATTWAIFSLLLAIAAYFRFPRFFGLRNWDIVSLYLFAPGLIAVSVIEREMGLAGRRLSSAAAGEAPVDPLAGLTDSVRVELHDGYRWLLLISAYFFVRCLLDPFLSRRPRLPPNLNSHGLAFLGIALLAFLMHQVMVLPVDPWGRAAAHAAYIAWSGPDHADGLREGGEDDAGSSDSRVHATPTAIYSPLLPLHRLVADRVEPDVAPLASDTEIAVTRTAVILCHVLILTALILIGAQHFRSAETGIAMAVLYLLLPMTAVSVERIDQLLPSVLLVWSVYAYRVPWLVGALFGLACEFVFPIFLVPLWFGFYWKRGGRSFLIALLATFFAVWAVVWWLTPLKSPLEVWTRSIAWQSWALAEPGVLRGFWSESTQFYRIPIKVLFAFFAGGLIFWPRDKDVGEVIALSAAVILGVQFWYADRGGAHLHWYLPLLLLMIFRPTLRDAQPRPAQKPPPATA